MVGAVFFILRGEFVLLMLKSSYKFELKQIIISGISDITCHFKKKEKCEYKKQCGE